MHKMSERMTVSALQIYEALITSSFPYGETEAESGKEAFPCPPQRGDRSETQTGSPGSKLRTF